MDTRNLTAEGIFGHEPRKAMLSCVAASVTLALPLLSVATACVIYPDGDPKSACALATVAGIIAEWRLLTVVDTCRRHMAILAGLREATAAGFEPTLAFRSVNAGEIDMFAADVPRRMILANGIMLDVDGLESIHMLAKGNMWFLDIRPADKSRIEVRLGKKIYRRIWRRLGKLRSTFPETVDLSAYEGGRQD